MAEMHPVERPRHEDNRTLQGGKILYGNKTLHAEIIRKSGNQEGIARKIRTITGPQEANLSSFYFLRINFISSLGSFPEFLIS
jgi:hypothetical protein